MHLKIFVILVVITLSSAEESKDDIQVGVNATDIYYKGFKVRPKDNHCVNNLCVFKCCPFGSSYYPQRKNCSNETQPFDHNLYDEYMRPHQKNASDEFYFQIKTIRCEEKIRFQILAFVRKRQKEFYLRKDGKLYVEAPNNVPPYMLFSPENYCIDNFVIENEDGTLTTEVDALACMSEDQDINNYILSSTCMLISCVFILATVSVYTWLPQLHNIHGRVLVAYLLCLFVGFIFMASLQILMMYQIVTSTGCLVMSFFIYFFLLSAFFWLNVMSFDIWRVFSGKRQVRLKKVFIRSKIRTYAMYAFGVPALLTIILIGLEFSGLPPSPWLPMLRYQGCFLTGNSRLLYFYGPIVILCAANTTLFLLTALKIAKTSRDISSFDRDSSRHDQRNNDKQRLYLYVKLFIVMGINWILEVLSSLYKSTYWEYTDAYNVLIGVTIFIIFVCKRKIIKLLKERYKMVRHGPVSQSNTSWSRANSSKDEMALTAQ